MSGLQNVAPFVPYLCVGTLYYVPAAEVTRDQANWLLDIEDKLLRKMWPRTAFSVKKSQEDSKCI